MKQEEVRIQKTFESPQAMFLLPWVVAGTINQVDISSKDPKKIACFKLNEEAKQTIQARDFILYPAVRQSSYSMGPEFKKHDDNKPDGYLLDRQRALDSH